MKQRQMNLLNKLSVRNTNKKLKRRDDKIVELKEQVKGKEKYAK